jgi:hypothetical protein
VRCRVISLLCTGWSWRMRPELEGSVVGGVGEIVE